jgi:hypothetical protein
MRATGDTPQQLAGQVLGTLELLEFYLNDRTLTVTGNSGNIVSATTSVAAALIVPNNRLWLVWGVTLSSGLTGAGTGMVITGGIVRNVGGTSIYQALTDRQSVGPVETANVGAVFARPVLAQPSDQFAVRCSAILTAAPNIPVTIAIHYAELLI